MAAWSGPIATHGMSADQVRSALQEVAAQMLNDWRREQRAAGVPLEIIEAGAALSKRLSDEHIERQLPSIMRDLAITAGAAASH